LLINLKVNVGHALQSGYFHNQLHTDMNSGRSDSYWRTDDKDADVENTLIDPSFASLKWCAMLPGLDSTGFGIFAEVVSSSEALCRYMQHILEKIQRMLEIWLLYFIYDLCIFVVTGAIFARGESIPLLRPNMTTKVRRDLLKTPRVLFVLVAVGRSHLSEGIKEPAFTATSFSFAACCSDDHFGQNNTHHTI
jgi:hypothetical protein